MMLEEYRRTHQFNEHAVREDIQELGYDVNLIGRTILISNIRMCLSRLLRNNLLTDENYYLFIDRLFYTEDSNGPNLPSFYLCAPIFSLSRNNALTEENFHRLVKKEYGLTNLDITNISLSIYKMLNINNSHIEISQEIFNYLVDNPDISLLIADGLSLLKKNSRLNTQINREYLVDQLKHYDYDVSASLIKALKLLDERHAHTFFLTFNEENFKFLLNKEFANCYRHC